METKYKVGDVVRINAPEIACCNGGIGVVLDVIDRSGLLVTFIVRNIAGLCIESGEYFGKQLEYICHVEDTEDV